MNKLVYIASPLSGEAIQSMGFSPTQGMVMG